MSLQLNTPTGTFGPHETITDEGAVYLADGVTEYPKEVVGVGTIEPYVEPQEVADARARLFGKVSAEEQFERDFDAELKSLDGLDNTRIIMSVLFVLIEIRAYQANNSVPTPAIDKLVQVWGGTKSEAVTRVLKKYGPKAANLIEKFAIREDAIDALP